MFFSHTVTNHAQSFWPNFLLEFWSAKCILFSPDWPDVVTSVLVTYMYGRWQVAYAYIRHCLWLYIVHNVSYCHSLPRSSLGGGESELGVGRRAGNDWKKIRAGAPPLFSHSLAGVPSPQPPNYRLIRSRQHEKEPLRRKEFYIGFCFRLWKLQQVGLY